MALSIRGHVVSDGAEPRQVDWYGPSERNFIDNAVRRGTGKRAALLEACPPDDLVGYFDGLEVGKLAACWVACVSEALSLAKHHQRELEVGNLTRALCLVAERLHGVKFEEQVMAEVPSVGKRAAVLVDGDVAWSVGDAPEPVKFAGSAKAKKFSEVLMKLEKAPVGAWLIVGADVCQFRGGARSLSALRRHKFALADKVEFYKDAAGRSVLKKVKE